MLKNYIVVTLRNLRRNKGYSFINILGLALSLGLGLLLIQMIVSFTSFDEFQANKDRVFRLITTRTGGNEARDFATAPFPLAPALAAEVPGVEASAVWAWGIGGNGVCRGKVLPFWANFAGPDFFRVFSYRLERGDPTDALREPYSIVLAAQVAERFFGGDDPVGEIIRLGQWGDYKITGVLEDMTRLMTHLEVGSLVSLSTMPALEGRKLLTPRSESWTDLNGVYGYVLLRPGTSPRQVEDAANRLAAGRVRDDKFSYRFRLQGLTAIANGPKMENNTGDGAPMAVVYVLAAVAALVVLSAAFNYTNLSIARALSRGREVGIRKVVGAKRRQLFAQFIGEAVVIALLSFVGAFVLYRAVFMPLLRGLDPKFATYFQFRETWSTLAIFLAFAAFTGVVAGALPALRISRFQPVQALRDQAGMRVVSRITTRKVLIVFQFGLSVAFIISTLVAIDQLRMVRRTDLGFRPAGIISVSLEGVDYGRFRQGAAQEPGILAVAGAERIPGVTSILGVPLTRGDRPVTKDVCVTAADSGYVPVVGLRLLAGANFSETGPSSGETPLIINETAVRQLEYGTPEAAVGQVLSMKDGRPARVVGVVADFVHGRVSRDQGALALAHRPEACGTVLLRVAGTEVKAVADRLLRLWAAFESAAPFEYARLTDLIEDRMTGERVMMKSIRFVAGLAVFVTCLGLLGIADYSSRVRRREIGIRKVVGAGDWTLVRLLSQGYLAMLAVGSVAAVPVAWGFNKLVLSLYDKAVGQRAELFLAGVAIVGALGLATVLSQTVRAARVNPADIIRHE
ncbi:MAG: ABC transporter permease [Candidatus Aminicenantes bacterium]|nr:ABC transporter permease [Candidatus Aminicenantes bacterium]